MHTSVMPRLRHRRNYTLAALLLTSITYLVLQQRDDLRTRIATTDSGSLATTSRLSNNAMSDPNNPPPFQLSQEAAQIVMTEIPMSYGTASHPPTKGLSTLVADLPREYIPSPANHRRLIIVGDVHGQLSALQSLLSAVSFSKETDHLIFTGDLISKGPDSAGVVQLAMDLGASAVRGNHEDRVLLAHREAEAAAKTPPPGGDRPAGSWLDRILGSGGDDAGPDPRPSPGTEKDLAVASGLSRAQLSWLASLPIILRIPGPLPGGAATRRPWNAGAIAVVHAGLVPGVPLERQDPRAAMNMRSLVYPAETVRRDRVRRQLEDEERKRQEERAQKAKERGESVEVKVEIKDTQVDAEMERLERDMGFDPSVDRRVWLPVDGRAGEPWSEVWSRYQSRIERDGDRMVVVYGHDAKAGLRVGEVENVRQPEVEEQKKHEKEKVERYAFGLDSGCVYGNQLSALVLEVGDDGGVAHRLVQVACEKAAAAPKN